MLRRSLNLFSLTMIAIGCSIGSGIFRAPGGIAAEVFRPEYVIALWVLGGIVALTGALTYAEMSSMFPEAGGLYVFLRKAYGDMTAFLYGWFILFVSTSGAIAALSLVCAEHLLYLWGYPANSGYEVLLAIGIVLFLTTVNMFGVKLGGQLASLFTGAKLAGLALIIVVGWLFAQPSAVETNATGAFVQQFPQNPWTAFAAAFVGVLFSYGGWQHASFMAGETVNPQRTVPRAMMLGALIVTLVYVLANLAYMRLLPMEQLAVSTTVAADAVSTRYAWGGNLMAFLIALSTFGTTSIYSMTAPRMYFAMAQDGIFFPQLAKVHEKWQTPVNAMFLQAGWSVVLLLVWGKFGKLIDYITFIDWIGLVMVASAIFVFRRSMPDAPRPYRTAAYPWPPVIFIALSMVFIVLQLFSNPVVSGAGLAVVAVGALAYWGYFRKLRPR